MKDLTDYPETVGCPPCGIITALVSGREIGIGELSPEHVKLRFKEKEAVTAVSFCCYFPEEGYVDFGPFPARFVKNEDRDFYTEMTFEIPDPAFRSMVRRFTAEYLAYIRARLGETDTVPGLKERGSVPGSVGEWLEGHRKEFRSLSDFVLKAAGEGTETALSLESGRTLQAWISGRSDECFPEKLPELASRIYLGNPWCPFVCGEEEELAAAEKALSEGKKITVVTSWLKNYTREAGISRLLRLSGLLRARGVRAELEVNDWGFLPVFSETSGLRETFTCSLGRLLNKQRRDPRFREMYGISRLSGELSGNSLLNPDYRKWLSELGFTRAEYEQPGFPLSLSPFPGSLHVPFYQTNTSPYCPVYSLSETGTRDRGGEVRKCPKYCEHAVQLYPTELSLIGRFNSLFGIADTELGRYFREYRKNGIDRIVFSALPEEEQKDARVR